MHELELNMKEINNGLSFYNIEEKEYKEKCYDCLKYILKYDTLKNSCYDIYKILYNSLTSKIRPLWKMKKTEELFGNKYHPFVTNLLLLLGYKVHRKNIQNCNLDDKQVSIHKKRIREALTNDIYRRHLDGIRISQLLWGVYFINIKLIEVGRLQYEHYEDENDSYIKIHIPADDKLVYNEVVKSIKESKKDINKYFKLENYKYYCSSWLLSKEIYNLIDKNSNIAKFQSLFEIEKGNNCLKDILNFVYKKQECNDFTTLEETTSLQRSIKKYLLSNQDINIGNGKLKNIFS